MFDIYCISAALLGVFLGYFFGWTTRNQQPSATEFSTLFSTVLGGAVTTLLGQINCPYVLPVYIIGVVAGYVIYLVLLQLHWPSIATAMNQGALSRPPLVPWRVPSVQTDTQAPRITAPVSVVSYDERGRVVSIEYLDGTRADYTYT